MTSASELFYNRRSRLGRIADIQPRLSPPRDKDLRHRHGRGRHDVAGPTRIRSRYFYHVRERESITSDQQPASICNEIGEGVFRSRLNRLSSIRNEQLPSLVLQARERLVQRLRGFSLSESREDHASASFVSRRDNLNVGSSDESYAENEGDQWWSSTILIDRDEDVQQNISQKSPPGLGWNVLCNLRKELFEDENYAEGSPDCSICLEKFCDGDDLIRLSCSHRFHPNCLEPWLRISLDCPYCRARITC